MDIMDELLDLKDRLEETFDREKRRARAVVRGEGGFSTLVTVLAIMAVGAVIITPILALVITGQRAGRVHNEVMDRLYAADTGMQDALWRINSDDLPVWMDGTWDTSVYAHPAQNYSLPYDVNGCQVQVTMQPLWLLTGMEPMPGRPGEVHEPDESFTTFSDQVSAGHYQIVILFDEGENPKMERIGCWLPQGYDYIPGTSNLEDDDKADYYCVPTVQDGPSGLGGHVVIWEFDPVVEFRDLPGGAESRIEITFDYTPVDKTVQWTFSWSKAQGIAVSWSADVKIFQIESTSTHRQTGNQTTVVSAKMSNEALTTGLAVNGDYAVTGNALILDANEDGYYRERAYLESPGTISNISSLATANTTTVYWSGWKASPLDVWYENSDDVSKWSPQNQAKLEKLVPRAGVNCVSVKVTVGADTLTIDRVQAELWQVVPNADNPHDRKPWEDAYANGWYYSCRADITHAVRAHFGEDFDGNATYTVGHANLSVDTGGTLRAIWGADADNIWAVGDGGRILKYNGASWQTQASNTTKNLYGIWGSDSSNIWAVGASGTILKYNGTSWVPQASSGSTLYGIWGYDSSNIWAVGASGTIRKYDGTSWGTPQASGTTDLYGVWGSSAKDVWAVGDRRTEGWLFPKYYYTIRHTTNGGTTWTDASPSADSNAQNLNAIWGSDSSNIWAVGAGGTIRKYNGSWGSGGASGTTKDLNAIWGSDSSNIWAVGASGTIRMYNGTSWQPQTSDSSSTLYGVWGSALDNVYAVGGSQGLIRYDGENWFPLTGGGQLYQWQTSSIAAYTNYPLGDRAVSTSGHPNYQAAYAAWSVVVIFTSPETRGHQLYVFDDLKAWLHYQVRTETITGFLAPQDVRKSTADDPACRLTCFVGEGDAWYNNTTPKEEEKIWLGNKDGDWLQLNTQVGSDWTNPTPYNNVWNSVSNVMTPSPTGLDIDTFVIPGNSGIISPGDDTAYLKMSTGQDVWVLIYVILSFKSDLTSSGVMSYIVK